MNTPKNVTICYYLRPEELPSLALLPDFTSPVAEDEIEGTQSLGFNFVNLDILQGMKVIAYKLEVRGKLFFLSVTFTSETDKRDLETAWPYFDLLCTVADDQNSRWLTAKYTLSNGDVRFCSRERMNTVRKNRPDRPMFPVIF